MDSLGEIRSAEKASPRYSVTYLLWQPKTSGRTTLDILLEGLDERGDREILKFIPPRNSQDFYEPKGLPPPLAEVVLRMKNPTQEISSTDSRNFYWLLESRGFQVLSYTFNDEREKVVDNCSPGLKQR